MSTADLQIADILAQYGEPLAGNIWRVQGQAVIYHKALERIAAQAGITFGRPTILRAERDEAVVLVTGNRDLSCQSPANLRACPAAILGRSGATGHGASLIAAVAGKIEA